MSNKLFVRNLSWGVREDDLYDLFGEVGEVISVKIPTRPEDGKSKGFAFVEMATPEQGEAAIRQLNGVFLQNRDLVVAAQSDHRPDFRSNAQGAAPGPNSKLFIRNLGPQATESQLHDLFAQIAPVLSVRIPVDPETGRVKGFGFVELETPDAAAQALAQLNGAEFQGMALAIDYQDPTRSKKKPFSGGGGYGNSRYGGGGRYENQRSARW
jgi:nucleolin